MTQTSEVVLVVEDELSEAVMRKVIASQTPTVSIGSRVIRSGGFGNIKKQMPKFKNACFFFPHIVLTDLDRHLCATALLTDWSIQKLPSNMVFRIAVRSVESWLLADRESIAHFLSIPKSKVSQAPEALIDSKRELLSLARKGRRRRLESELCPAIGSIAKQGPLYNAHMVRFVRDSWQVDVAAEIAPSLSRARHRISELAATLDK